MALKLIAPKSKTSQIRISLDIKDGPKGYFIGNAYRLSEPERKALIDEKLDNDEYLKRIYESFEGLSNEAGEEVKGEAAWKEVLEGRWSWHLISAAVTCFFEDYSNSTVKNSRR